MKSSILLSRNRKGLINPSEKTGPTTGPVLLLINCGNNVELQMKTKIYALRDEDRWLRYVGRTGRSLEIRLAEHLDEARKGGRNRRSREIRAMLSQGFIPTISLITEANNGIGAERAYIKYFKDSGVDLWNMTDGGEGFEVGHVMSEKTKRKLSLALTGKQGTPWSNDHRAKWNNSIKEYWDLPGTREDRSTKAKESLTPAVRNKISEALKGRPRPEDVIERVRQANRRACRTPEFRKRMSLLNKGRIHTSETRMKNRLAKLGTRQSTEHRKNISSALKGRMLSIEHRKNLSIAARNRKP